MFDCCTPAAYPGRRTWPIKYIPTSTLLVRAVPAVLQSISVSKLAHLAEIDEATLRAQLVLMQHVGQVVTWTRGDALQVRPALLPCFLGLPISKGAGQSGARTTGVVFYPCLPLPCWHSATASGMCAAGCGGSCGGQESPRNGNNNRHARTHARTRPLDPSFLHPASIAPALLPPSLAGRAPAGGRIELTEPPVILLHTRAHPCSPVHFPLVQGAPQLASDIDFTIEGQGGEEMVVVKESKAQAVKGRPQCLCGWVWV